MEVGNARDQMPTWSQQALEYNLALYEYLLRRAALEQQSQFGDAANAYYAQLIDRNGPRRRNGGGKNKNENKGGGGGTPDWGGGHGPQY